MDASEYEMMIAMPTETALKIDSNNHSAGASELESRLGHHCPYIPD
jgi:hypothetical protein